MQVVYLFVKGFVILVMIASIVAIPVSWYAMSIWLQNFAHQTPMYWWLFLLAVIIALTVASLTLIFQSVRAANKNPVDAIRWE
jgi:putative ABC transport system permease protein